MFLLAHQDATALFATNNFFRWQGSDAPNLSGVNCEVATLALVAY